MKVIELKKMLESMPDGCDVYLQQDESSECFLVYTAEYSDSLGDPDGSDRYLSDGIILRSGFIIPQKNVYKKL